MIAYSQTITEYYTLVLVDRIKYGKEACGILVTKSTTCEELFKLVRDKLELSIAFHLQLSCDGQPIYNSDDVLDSNKKPRDRIILVENGDDKLKVTPDQLLYFTKELDKIHEKKKLALEVELIAEEIKTTRGGGEELSISEYNELENRIKDHLERERLNEEHTKIRKEKKTNMSALRQLTKSTIRTASAEKNTALDWNKWDDAYNSDDDIDLVQEILNQNMIIKRYTTDYKGWEKFDTELYEKEMEDESVGGEFSKTEVLKSNNKKLLFQLAGSNSRRLGNLFYKRKDYVNASKEYIICIKLEKTSSVHFANLSQAYIALGIWNDAIIVSTAAIELDPSCVKAFMRRAHARRMKSPKILNELKLARSDLCDAARIEPISKNSQLSNQILKQSQKVCLEIDKVISGYYT